jgi:PAS domain S-box-containing protein
MLKKFQRLIVLQSFRDTLSNNDLVSHQRFRLFKITTLFSLIAYLALFYQILVLINGEYFLKGLITFLFALLFINYFGILYHKKQRFAYLTLVLLLFTLLHICTYYQGGVRNSGMFYLAGLLLAAYMLIGNKGGKLVAVLSVIHIVYFYFVARYTTWSSYELIGSDPALIDLDFLLTGVIAILVLTSQSDFLEKSKNAIINDIIEKKNELGVKNVELKKLSLVASKTNNGVIITDNFGRVEWVNDGFTRLMGFSFDEIVGKKSADLIHGEETSTETIETINQKLAQKESCSEELIKYHKDGRKIWVQENITPILDDNDNVIKFIYIESDITLRKAAEAKEAEYLRDLEKTIRELDKFAYVVSHDLKAPLRAIGNLTGWIEEDIGDTLPPDVLKNFNIIKGRVVRMEALIDGILDYSKAGKSKGQFVTVDTKTLLRETFDLVGATETCKFEISNHLPTLYTDKIKLQQIFMNLINNAVKYNNTTEPYVKVDAIEEKNFWHFTVADNGPGIDKQFHEKIFVIFQTLNARDEVESTGVGLAIVKKIIEEHEGKIWVESEKGKGSVFHFTWPKTVKSPEPVTKPEVAAAA